MIFDLETKSRLFYCLIELIFNIKRSFTLLVKISCKSVNPFGFYRQKSLKNALFALKFFSDFLRHFWQFLENETYDFHSLNSFWIFFSISFDGDVFKTQVLQFFYFYLAFYILMFYLKHKKLLHMVNKKVEKMKIVWVKDRCLKNTSVLLSRNIVFGKKESQLIKQKKNQELIVGRMKKMLRNKNFYLTSIFIRNNFTIIDICLKNTSVLLDRWNLRPPCVDDQIDKHSL